MRKPLAPPAVREIDCDDDGNRVGGKGAARIERKQQDRGQSA